MKKVIFLTVISLLLPALFFTLVGCMKVPSTEIDKGPTASCDQLDASVDRLSMGKVSDIKLGETSYREMIVAFDVMAPEVLQTLRYTVSSKEDKGNYWEMTITEDLQEKVDGQFKNSNRNTKIGVAKTALLSMNSVSQTIEKKLLHTLADSSPSDSFCSSTSASYHKLEVTEGEMDVPVKMHSIPGCGGLKNCDKIRVTNLKFDTWQKDQDGQEVKITHYLKASPDVPYFSSLMSHCLQYSMHYLDRQLLVTQCSDVKEFAFGADPTPTPTPAP